MDIMIDADASEIDLPVSEWRQAIAVAKECLPDYAPMTATFLAVARHEGHIVGALWSDGSDEWYVGVAEGYRGVGIATAMVKCAIGEGAMGFMVAGTEDGVTFLWNLYHALSEDEREALDVPLWKDVEAEMQNTNANS